MQNLILSFIRYINTFLLHYNYFYGLLHAMFYIYIAFLVFKAKMFYRLL